MTIRKMVLLVAVAVTLNGTVTAITGTEIALNAHNIDDALTAHSAVQMDLISANGDVDSRMIEEWSTEDEAELGSTLMVFRSPASVANTRFLQKESEGRDDDKWIYLPALKRVRRIASSDGDKSFMGTDMTYDDMEVRDVEQDTHELLGEERISTWDCYKVKAVSIDPEDSQYAYRITWFDKDSWVPVKVEMYDKSGVLCKTLQVESLEQVSGYWTPTSALITNVQTHHSTHISILKIEYDQPTNERLFTTAYLEQGR